MGTHVRSVLIHHADSQREWAKRARVAQSVLSRMCSGSRTTIPAVRRVIMAAPSDAARLDLAIAWIRDELERVGVDDSTIQIEQRSDARSSSAAIRVLEAAASGNAHLAAVLQSLANMVSQSETDGRSPRTRARAGAQKLKKRA